MRKGNTNGDISIHAISGSHVITLGFDAKDSVIEKLLGFAVHRTSFPYEDEPEEAYWLKGYKPFKENVPNPIPGAFYSTYEFPIQSFTWADYTVKPGRKYKFEIRAVTGNPKNLKYSDPVSVEIEAEKEDDGLHGIYFNRGVAASQAYALKFGILPPNKLPENRQKEVYAWLSRGLFEAIIAFIKKANDATYKLRVALYECDYLPVIEELKSAQVRGVDVQIIYSSEKTEIEDNETTLFNAGFTPNDGIVTIGRDKSGAIFHNKFFILLKDENPIEVFTGSTNISEGGIFGHSNVGHSVKDRATALKYYNYWELLKHNPSRADLCLDVLNSQIDSDINSLPDGISVMFSPRVNSDMLKHYVDAFAKAEKIANITLPFNVDKQFMAKLDLQLDTTLRYVTLNKDKEVDKKDRETKEIIKKGIDYVQHFRHSGNIFVAPGGKIENAWEQWLKEVVTGFNGSIVTYIHTKFMLIDPVSEKPTVITGSANFSENSMDQNDENMLIIKGNKRVADIYLGEFFRIFDHLYFRYIVSKFETAPDSGFLKSNPAEWTKLYLNEKSGKFKRRKVFGFQLNP